MGQARTQTVVLDAGALIALERADGKIRALLREALKSKSKLVVPAGVLAQVWRDGPRQVLLRGLLNGPTTAVVALDQTLAEASGTLCGRTRTSDIVDASVVLTAKRERAVVVTSDVEDLKRLDSTLIIHRI